MQLYVCVVYVYCVRVGGSGWKWVEMAGTLRISDLEETKHFEATNQ